MRIINIFAAENLKQIFSAANIKVKKYYFDGLVNKVIIPKNNVPINHKINPQKKSAKLPENIIVIVSNSYNQNTANIILPNTVLFGFLKVLPHLGQVNALSLTSVPQSGHFNKGIVILRI